jgi:hypothetical protein
MYNSFNQRFIFFTRNGVMVGFTSIPVRPGMELYPAVSLVFKYFNYLIFNSYPSVWKAFFENQELTLPQRCFFLTRPLYRGTLNANFGEKPFLWDISRIKASSKPGPEQLTPTGNGYLEEAPLEIIKLIINAFARHTRDISTMTLISKNFNTALDANEARLSLRNSINLQSTH